jgi:hypothetical protein
MTQVNQPGLQAIFGHSGINKGGPSVKQDRACLQATLVFVSFLFFLMARLTNTAT